MYEEYLDISVLVHWSIVGYPRGVWVNNICVFQQQDTAASLIDLRQRAKAGLVEEIYTLPWQYPWCQHAQEL